MNKHFALLIAIFIIVVLAGIVLVFLPSKKAMAPTQSSQNGATTIPVASQKPGIADLITVDAPAANATVSSPLVISGQARGTWYFEASFPVVLKDASGKVIAQAGAKAQGDWMTTNFVPFMLSLPFPAQPKGSKGTLTLHNDNPSGDPTKDRSVEISVVF